jgi:cobyrinic acid a,c-diamide synthase
MDHLTKAFIIAGTRSGVGKTTLTLGIMEALRRRGIKVQPFKAGPDYIDPGYHTALCRSPSYNLDTWMMGTKGVKTTFFRAMDSRDIGVVEGVMGLFDGKSGSKVGGEGSTAHIAKVLGLPVLLVVNASGISGSVGALVKGFERFDHAVKVAGVIFNSVGSLSHYALLKSAVTEHTGVRVFGFLPFENTIKLPHRHLGLVTRGDLTRGEWGRFLMRVGSLVEKNVDIEGILKALPLVRPKRSVFKSPGQKPIKSHPKIAVARDRAFCFYYRENLEILERSGGKVAFFSPLKDKRLPEGTNGIYLGGGYPELYARGLERNSSLREEIKKFARAGYPVYAECGGLMYMGRALKDLEGRTHSMAGVFPWTSRMLGNRKSLGYRELKARPGCPFLKRGAKIRGHEYHYSEIASPPSRIKRVFELCGSGGEGIEGYLYKNTLASYVHLHFASNPAFAEGFVRLINELD